MAQSIHWPYKSSFVGLNMPTMDQIDSESKVGRRIARLWVKHQLSTASLHWMDWPRNFAHKSDCYTLMHLPGGININIHRIFLHTILNMMQIMHYDSLSFINIVCMHFIYNIQTQTRVKQWQLYTTNHQITISVEKQQNKRN